MYKYLTLTTNLFELIFFFFIILYIYQFLRESFNFFIHIEGCIQYVQNTTFIQHFIIIIYYYL